MNPRKKGNRAEIECKKLLEGMGFSVVRTVAARHGDKDFFNAFDLIALSEVPVKFNFVNGYCCLDGILVQVRSNRIGPKDKVKAFKNYPHSFKKCIAVKKDRKGWFFHLLDRKCKDCNYYENNLCTKKDEKVAMEETCVFRGLKW